MNENLKAKIEALLTKAESTTSENEAEVARNLANKLMLKHSIDASMLDSGTDPAEISVRHIELTGSYIALRRGLYMYVARAFKAKAVYTKGGTIYVTGSKDKLDTVRKVYESLLVQMTNAAAQQPVPAHVSTKSFRTNFQKMWSHRVWERLEEQQKEAVEEATTEHGSSVAVVLASEEVRTDQAFNDWMRETYPGQTVVTRRTTIGRAGMAEGEAAGDRADIGNKRMPSSQRALNA